MKHHPEFTFMPIFEMADKIKKKEISPVELTESVLDRISKLNPGLNAYYSIFTEEVLSAAREAESRVQAGEYIGPLHGVPFAVKDLFRAGRTTCGSSLNKDYIAPEDCTVVKRLKQAGALLLGKLAMYEFAAGLPTLSSYFKPTRNPWNLKIDTGGSSSGSAAAVAAGLAFAAMGSDTGGSIRWPAFCCGVVGMMPTYGRVSKAGVFPLSWSLDHAGPMTRTVRDSALVLQACAGYDPLDPTSSKAPVPDFSEKLGRDIKGIRIGIPRSLFADSCNSEILGAFDKAVEIMEDLGADVVEVESFTFEEIAAAFWFIMSVEAAAYHRENLKERAGEFNPDLRMTLATGVLLNGPAYIQAQRSREQIRRKLLRQFESMDILMTPTSGFMPGPIMSESPGLILMSESFPLYTPLSNLAGLPTLALPCGFNRENMPVGFQLAGRPFDEATVFQVGYAYEQSTIWHEKHPDI